MSSPGPLTGLTWDHPRGYVVLDALAGAGRPPSVPRVRWDRQPLEGFESRPLRDLAGDYDLVVIDHPGLGEAIGDGALRPIDSLFPAAELDGWASVSAGRSYDSYRVDGAQWALPLDAAAQVSVARAGRLESQPVSWAEAGEAARRHRTAVCLGGPHALLMFSAICVALGASPISEQGCVYARRETGLAALDIMAGLLGQADRELAGQNPIGVLDAMSADGGPEYCPLVFGYVSYQRSRPGHAPLAAFDAPAGVAGIGSVLGGTGIAVTRSCTDLGAARALIRHLLSEPVQTGVYAQLGGQSADRRAWRDPAADARAGGFYSATARTIEAAWVRPRFAGYVPFQSAASAVLRDGLLSGVAHGRLLDQVDELFAVAGGAAAGKLCDERLAGEQVSGGQFADGQHSGGRLADSESVTRRSG